MAEHRADKMRENRSYVIRQVRMSPAQREAYRRLAPLWTIEPGTGPIDWDREFGRSGATRVVDIGFGMGMELAELAERRPDIDFLGIEVHRPGVGRLLGQIEQRKLQNVRIVRADAVEVVDGMLTPGSVDAVHLFFPDPWPKKRHHKRRLVRPGFPELISRVLRPGGYLYMVTDWENYAEQMMTVLGSSTAFRNKADSYAEPQPWRPQTAFERKGLAQGHRIFELMFTRL